MATFAFENEFRQAVKDNVIVGANLAAVSTGGKSATNLNDWFMILILTSNQVSITPTLLERNRSIPAARR